MATTYLYALTAKAPPAAGDYLHLASTADSGADRKVLVSALFTSPALTTPSLGAATATSLAASGAVTAASFNGLTLTSTTGTLTLANGSSLITSGAFAATLVIGANVTLTLPTTSATLARTDAGQTFSGTQAFAGITASSLAATGAISSSSASAGIGYATGAGIACTQLTSVTTTVTGNGICGTITTYAQTAAAGVDVSFTFTNSSIAANDVVVVSVKSYAGTADGIPVTAVQATAAGSCIINIRNTGATTLDALVVLNFAIIKAVAS